MARVKIELAVPSDDEAIRTLQSRLSMPGLYRISSLRDPSFFKALNVEGRFHQTIIGRDRETGAIVGWGNRSIRPAYVNSNRGDIGYLSGLRVLREHSGVFSLIRGYKMLRQLHQDGRTPFYLTTILGENIQAQNFLTSHRRGLPRYHAYGQLHCKAVSLVQTMRIEKSEKIVLRSATKEDLELILKFLRDEGRKKQFYPIYQEDDFFSSDGQLHALAAEDMILALRGNELVGLVAAWNQQSFRASVITGYARWLAAARPLYNLCARLHGRPTLPKPGTKLNCFYLSLLAVRNDEHNVFRNLLCELMERHRDRHDFMIAGLHTSHPLLPVLRELKGNDYRSQLYLVFWEDGAEAVSGLDGRPVYLEVGAL